MPTQLAQQLVTSSRHHETKSTDHSRRREMVCNLLTQIFVMAERKRATKSSARRRALGKDGEESEAQDPISLIELIQASYSVFERYGIGPPDDAVYHRYLLSLSIDPERDWHKKILNFDLGSQPRVKRLCSAAGHQLGATPTLTTNAHSSSKIREDVKTESESFEENRRRHRTGGKYNQVREASPLLTPTPTLRKTPISFPSNENQQDRFGDMLSLDSPIQKIRIGDNRGRRRMANALPDESGNDLKKRVEPVTPIPEVVINNTDDGEQSKNEDTSIPSTEKESARRRDRIAAGERKLQMITTSIEQWRATQAVKQLVDQNKLQDRKTRQQQVAIPLCIHALFHWIALCLPEKIDFHATESPRALPLCILRRISVDLKVFKYSAKRVWMWQMRNFLLQWRRDARAVKTYRVRMIVKQRAAVLETVFQCIQRWRLFTETKKCSTDRAQWIAQRCSRSTLRICLERWQRIFQSRQQQNQVNRHFSTRVMRKVLKSWQEVVESRRDDRYRFETARKRRIFSRWKREKERKQASRALLCVSSDQRRMRMMSNSWNQLRGNILRNKAIRMRINLWGIASRKRQQHRFIRLWKIAIDRQRDIREREERFDRFSRRRRQTQAFVAWAGWTDRQMSLRRSLSDVMETRAANQLADCFDSWRKYHAEASSIEGRLIASVTQTRRRRIWGQWRKITGTRNAIRCLDAAYSFHLLGKVFSRWKQHAGRKLALHVAYLECQQLRKTNILALHWKFLVANMQSQHQKKMKAEHFGEIKLLKAMRVCFLSWQRHVNTRRECRLRGESLKSSVRRRGLIHLTWSAWRHSFWSINVARLADDQLHTHRKANTFRIWKQFVHENHQRHQRALKVAAMLGGFYLNACFRQWKQFIVSKHRLAAQAEIVQQRIRKRLLVSRWEAWRHALKTKRGQYQKLSAVASRWQNRQIYASFYSWKTTWSIRKRHRRLLQSTLLTSQHKVLEAHFNAWKGSHHAAAAREHLILEAQDKSLRFKVKRAIHCWNSLRLEQHRRSCLLVKALALQRQTLLASIFRCLLRNKQARMRKRSRGSQAESHRRKYWMQRVFSTWSKWWQAQEKAAMKLDATKHQLKSLKLKRSIQMLKLNAQSSKRLKAAHVCAEAMSFGHTKHLSFSRWKVFVAQKHINQRNSAARAASMRNFRLRSKIHLWRKFVQIRKLMKHTLTRAAKASTASQLQLHFRIWKLFVERQVFARALEKKAVAFRYFCLLPLYFRTWKTFLQSRKRQQELLLRARGLWCHQTESRAFKTWAQYALSNRQTKCAVAKWSNQAMSRSFASWKRFDSLQKKKQRDQVRAVNFYEYRTYRRVLREWSLTARHDRLARRCARLWYQNTARRTFGTWTRHVRILQSRRTLLATIRQRVLVQVFTAWKEGIERKAQQLQGIQERFELLWMSDTRQTTFARWKRYARLRQFIRNKLAGQREILLYEVVKRWRLVATSQRQCRPSALLVSKRTKLSLMRTFMNNWRAKAWMLRCVKLLRVKVTGNRTTSCLRNCLCRWKQITQLSVAMKRFIYRRKFVLLRLAFVDGFQQFAAMKRREHDLAKQIGCIHEAFMKEWLARKLQQRMTVIAACEEIRRSGCSKRLLTAAWHEWIQFHSRKQAQQASVRQLRVQVSRLEDQDHSLNTNRLTGMLRRWKAVRLARVFERWSDVTQSLRQARLNSLKAIELWHKIQCGRYFQGWFRFCQQQKKQRRIRAMNTRSKKKRTWKLWRVFTDLSLSKKAVSLHARQFHAKHVYKNAFKTWRAVAASIRMKRDQIMELYHSSRLRLLAVLLGEWRQFAAVEKTKHMQTTVARVVYEDKLKRRSFTEWKTNVAGICYHRRQLQINTERLQVLLLCSSFRAWHSWIRQHKKLRVILQMLSSKRNSRTASQILTAWHIHTEKNAGLRHQALTFLRFRRIQKGVNALRSLTLEQQYLRSVRQKAQLFRSAVSGNQISAIFAQWKNFAQEKREGKDKIRSAIVCWENAFLRKIWNALVYSHKVEKQRHAMISCAELHHRNHRLRKSLVQWCHVKMENQHFRAVCGKLLSRWRMQTAYRCFCALHDHAVYHKTLRASENAIRGKMRSTALLQAWYAWHKLILISRSGKQRLLRRYFTAWIQSRESRKVLQVFREQIQSRLLRSTQRQCMANWRDFVAAQKIEKAMVLMSAAFGDTQLMKRVWICWMKFGVQSRDSKTRMRNALAHMQLQCQFKAFRALRAHALLQKRKTHTNTRAIAFRSYQLRTRSIAEWRSAVVARISRRQKLVYYLDVMQHAVQKRSFNAWYAFTARRTLLREKVSQSLALRTQMCSRMVFQLWKVFVMKARRNRMAHEFSAAKTSFHAIKHWKQYIVLCKIERMIGASEQRHVESSFLSWRKAVAETHQIRAFQAKSAKRHWIELVGMVFKAWKLRSKTQAHCRKLLASVAVGNHLRFRFVLWQKFAAHRKRLANLLLVVVDPPAPLRANSPADEIGVSTTEDANSSVVEGEEGDEICFTATLNAPGVGMESIDSALDTIGGNREAQISADDLQLVSLGQALAKKARVLQRFEVTWDLPQTWHRWRQIFHAQLFYRMRRLQLHFICWQRFAHEQRRNRWIVIKLTKQRQAVSASTVFLAWKVLVARVKQLQKDRLRERGLWVLVTTEMARRERRQLKTHWRAWKFQVDEARHLQSSLDAYHRARLLTKYWLVWCHDFRQAMAQANRETQRIEAHMNVFHVRRAIQSLRDNQQRTKRTRLVLEYFGNRHYDALLPDVLARWRKWCQRQKEIARCLDEARLRKIQRQFTTWKVWKNTRKWRRVALHNFQSKGVEQRRRDVWMRWQRFTKAQIVKDLALQKAMVFHISTRLRKRWLRHSRRAIQLREQADAAHVRLCVFRGLRVVSRWRDYSRARRLRRLYQRFVLRKHIHLWQSVVKHAVATRFDEFLLRSKAKKMLVAWRQIAARHQFWRQLCASIVGKKEARTAQRSFLRWQQFVNACQGKRLAAMHAEQSLLRKVWRLWNHDTMVTLVQRHEQYERAVEHEALTVLHQSLAVWLAAVKKQRERRFVLLSCVVKLKSVAGQRVQEVVFRAWRRVVEREHRVRAALIKRDCYVAQCALSCWSVWIKGRQRRRQQLESGANYHSQRLKSTVFFYWQTYALAWQDAAKPIARRHDRHLSLPTKIVAEPRSSDIFEDSDDSDADVRRPTSPVMKRLRQKNANRTSSSEDVGDSSVTVALSDAVEISMDVKKRLLLLGKWKPQHNGKFLSSSS